MNKEAIIKQLQFFVDGLAAGALNHEIHARIFGTQGFSKLAEKYNEHAREEREFVYKFMERILDLGGKLEHNEAQAFPVCESFEEYLNHELKQQAAGVAMIAELVNHDKLDHSTYELFKEYYFDEESDLYWMQQQAELIKLIGLQNYLAKQL